MKDGNRHGFTLIELLVVVAIIAILAEYRRGPRQTGRLATRLSHLKQIGTPARSTPTTMPALPRTSHQGGREYDAATYCSARPLALPADPNRTDATVTINDS
jgi:prepilin-type N-terminal cleavage/methylation domain-containing protein